MCDIKQKTQLKTMTVYKVVKWKGGEYISYFAEAPIRVGKLPNWKKSELRNWWINPSHPLHNKVSGFLRKEHAIITAEHVRRAHRCDNNVHILKIKLGAPILKGTTGHIISSKFLTWNGITYAGSEILSFEDVTP